MAITFPDRPYPACDCIHKDNVILIWNIKTADLSHEQIFTCQNTLLHKSLIVEMITKTENFRQYLSCFLFGIRVVFRMEIAVLEVTYLKHITVQEYAGQ